MRCPVICCSCEETVELSECAFHTQMCNCDLDEPCHHGICLECRSGGDEWRRDMEGGE